MKTTLPEQLHVVANLVAVFAAYLWLSIPWLSQYSLQAVAVCTLLYFGLNFAERRQGKVWHVLPSSNSALLGIVTFTVLLLIASTGSMSSPFYFLSYIYLFFLSMSTTPRNAIITMVAIIWFYAAIAPELTTNVLGHLIALPIVLTFFLFAKQQHEDSLAEKQLLDEEAELVTDLEQANSQLTESNAQLAQKIQATERSQSPQLAATGNQTNAKQTLETLNQVEQQLLYWQTMHFNCEPQEKATIDRLLDLISQAKKDLK